MAITRPAKIVASTAATRNPVKLTNTTARTSAHPRFAVRMPKEGRGARAAEHGWRGRLADRLRFHEATVSPAPGGATCTRSQPRTASRRDPDAGEPSPRWLLSALGAVVVVVVLAGFLVHLPYVVISPGTASPLDASVVTIDGAPTYEHDGEVLYLTVRVSGSDPNVWKLVMSWLDPDKEIIERNAAVGCLSDAENIAFNTRLMQQSQDDATKVALERLGYVVTAAPPEIVITEVSAGGLPAAGEPLDCSDAPASGILQAGDQIVAIDGQPVVALPDVSRLLDAHQPGDVVRVTVVRGGTTETFEVTAGGRAADGAPCVADAARGRTARASGSRWRRSCSTTSRSTSRSTSRGWAVRPRASHSRWPSSTT